MATRKANRKNRKNLKKQEGGKKTRKVGTWALKVKAVFKEMRRTDSSVSLVQAMREASRRKARGEL